MSMEPSRDEIKDWLNAILERTGETPSALARRAGLATTTLTRFLSDPHAPMLGLRSIAKITHVTGVPLSGVPLTGEPPPGMPAAEAEPFRVDQADEAMRNAIAALISTRTGMEAWVVQNNALELAGVLKGDVLIVDTRSPPASGDIVRVELRPGKQAAAETAFRLWQPPYLMPATIDRRRSKPLLVDHETVQITGRMQYLFRKG